MSTLFAIIAGALLAPVHGSMLAGDDSGMWWAYAATICAFLAGRFHKPAK